MTTIDSIPALAFIDIWSFQNDQDSEITLEVSEATASKNNRIVLYISQNFDNQTVTVVM